MAELKVAVMVDNMRMDLREAVKLVKTWGVQGAQLPAPLGMSKAERQDLLKFMKNEGVEISAICGWCGDLCEKEDLDEHIETAKTLLELAAEWECNIWQGHVGIMPWTTDDPKWETLINALGEIAEHGEKVGACLAMETGPEPPEVMKRAIETVGSPAIRVNYDPANFILWPPALFAREGKPYDKEEAFELFKPNEGADILGPYVVHTHAKDALVTPEGKGQEVPLGQGWVDWPRYVGLLQKHGFDGYFAIEREVGDDPVKDIKEAVNFLQSL